MSNANIYYWAPTFGPGFQDGIALVQDVNEDNEFVLVANTPGVPGVFSYSNILSTNLTVSKDVLRTINFTSDDDNSSCTFVINGIGAPVENGNPTALIGPISEEVTGPNADTVPSVNVYTKITSILVTNDDATNVSVGYGAIGITNYLYVDSYRIMGQMSGSYQFIEGGNIQVTGYASLNLPEYPNLNGSLTPFGIDSNPPVFIPGYVVKTATSNDSLFSYNDNMPLALVWNNVTPFGDAGILYGDSVYITILQQGIK